MIKQMCLCQQEKRPRSLLKCKDCEVSTHIHRQTLREGHEPTYSVVRCTKHRSHQEREGKEKGGGNPTLAFKSPEIGTLDRLMKASVNISEVLKKMFDPLIGETYTKSLPYAGQTKTSNTGAITNIPDTLPKGKKIILFTGHATGLCVF